MNIFILWNLWKERDIFTNAEFLKKLSINLAGLLLFGGGGIFFYFSKNYRPNENQLGQPLPIEFKENRLLGIVRLLGLFSFFLIGLVFIIYPEVFERGTNVEKQIIGVLAVLLAVIGIFTSIQIIIKPKVYLTITKNEIIIHSRIRKNTLNILWTEIDGFMIDSINHREFIKVYLKKEAQQRIKNENKGIKKILNPNASVSINPTNAGVSLENLFNLLNTILENKNVRI